MTKSRSNAERTASSKANKFMGDISDTTVAFAEPSTGLENIQSGESTKTSFGKIKKWLSSLKALAFKDTVGAADIDNSAVTEEKIASTAVTAAKLSSNAVLGDKIASNAVTEDKLGSNAVTTSKISAGAVTREKIAQGAVSKDKMHVSSNILGSSIRLNSANSYNAVISALGATTVRRDEEYEVTVSVNYPMSGNLPAISVQNTFRCTLSFVLVGSVSAYQILGTASTPHSASQSVFSIEIYLDPLNGGAWKIKARPVVGTIPAEINVTSLKEIY